MSESETRFLRVLGFIAGLLAAFVTESLMTLGLVGTSVGFTTIKAVVLTTAPLVGFIVWAAIWAYSFPRSR